MTTPPYPGQQGQPGQDPWSGQQPGPGSPGQQQPGQQGSAGQQGYPGQQYPGQQYPGQQYAGQGHPQQQGYAGNQGYGAPASSPYPGAYGGGYGGAEPPAPTRPATVTGAFICWVLTAVASIVSVVLVVNSPIWAQALDEAARQGSVSSSGVDPASLISAVKTVAVVVAVLFVALYLFFAFMMWGGRNWARIVLTVLAALTALSAFSSGVQSSVTINNRSYEANSTGTSWITVALAVIGLVLMYLPASNAYFTESKRRKAWKTAQGR